MIIDRDNLEPKFVVREKRYYRINDECRARESCFSDAEAIADIFNFYVELGGITYTNKKVQPSFFYDQLIRENILVGVAENKDGKVIAWAAWSNLYSFDNVVMISGYILPEYVNTGIVTSLWTDGLADEIAKFFGWDSYVVNISSKNVISIDIHKKIGFNVVGVIKGVSVGKRDKFDQIWMQREVIDGYQRKENR